MERPAFDHLLTATLPEIHQAARKYAMLYQRFYEWEDIVQTALLKMIRFASHYDPDKGELLPWACVIIINTIRTHISQSMTKPNIIELNSFIIEHISTHIGNNPEESAQESVLLSMLNDETRMYIEGYNYSEIAARCGFKSKVTAKNHIDKCVGLLCRITGIKVKQGPRPCRYANL